MTRQERSDMMYSIYGVLPDIQDGEFHTQMDSLRKPTMRSQKPKDVFIAETPVSQRQK